MEQMGNTLNKVVKEFIGTAAERATVVTTDLAAGSSYWATDTKVGSVWDGSAWQDL